MPGESKSAAIIQTQSSLLFYFFLSFLSNAASKTHFSPSVNYLIDCGSSNPTELQDGRTFRSDRDSTSLLSSDEDIQTSVDSLNINVSSSSVPPTSLPLFASARIFTDKSTYTFYISKMGRLWVRLYFFPLPHSSYNLTQAVFSVQTDQLVLLRDFSVKDNASFVFKEYLVNVFGSRFSLKFLPKKSLAFINAIEVVSAPDNLIPDTVTSVSRQGDFYDIFNHALQVCDRVNVGGLPLDPNQDTLLRSWENDTSYNVFPQGSKNVC